MTSNAVGTGSKGAKIWLSWLVLYGLCEGCKVFGWHTQSPSFYSYEGHILEQVLKVQIFCQQTAPTQIVSLYQWLCWLKCVMEIIRPQHSYLAHQTHLLQGRQFHVQWACWIHSLFMQKWGNALIPWLLLTEQEVYMGESWPRSSVQTECSEVRTHNWDHDSPIQTI